MHDVYTVLLARALHVFIQDGIGGTFLLPVSVDGQQTLHLLYHDDIGILVYNLHQFMVELFTSLLTADLYFHTRFQGKIVLCSDNAVHIYNAFA